MQASWNPPPGLSLVSNPVCCLHGQDLKAQLWRGGCLVWEPQGLCVMQIMWFCWHRCAMTFSVQWDSSQSSVKHLGWESAPRPWSSTGNRWNTPYRTKWVWMTVSGGGGQVVRASCSWLMVGWLSWRISLVNPKFCSLTQSVYIAILTWPWGRPRSLT